MTGWLKRLVGAGVLSLALAACGGGNSLKDIIEGDAKPITTREHLVLAQETEKALNQAAIVLAETGIVKKDSTEAVLIARGLARVRKFLSIWAKSPDDTTLKDLTLAAISSLKSVMTDIKRPPDAPPVEGALVPTGGAT